MYSVHEDVVKALEATQERMHRYADPHRKDNATYQVGDLLMLSGKNIQTRRPSQKLDHKNYGPFQVEKIVSPLAVKLTLPRKWKIMSFMCHWSNPSELGHVRRRTYLRYVLREADDIENSEEYDVDEVMASVKKGRRVLYLVKWLDFPDRQDWTNEPLDNFSVGGLEKLREFHRRNPDTPRDYRLTDGWDVLHSGRSGVVISSGSREKGLKDFFHILVFNSPVCRII
jgi:hypothetical protein